jgi:CRP-like cAMP-binding protein
MIEPSALQNHALFGGLQKEQIDRLLPLMERASYSVGELILTEGERNDRLYFILEGAVAVQRGHVSLVKMGEGDTFGEMEILDTVPAAATIRALSSVSLISLSNHRLHELYQSDIAIFAMLMMNLARELARRLRRMDQRVAPIYSPDTF